MNEIQWNAPINVKSRKAWTYSHAHTTITKCNAQILHHSNGKRIKIPCASTNFPLVLTLITIIGDATAAVCCCAIKLVTNGNLCRCLVPIENVFWLCVVHFISHKISISLLSKPFVSIVSEISSRNQFSRFYFFVVVVHFVSDLMVPKRRNNWYSTSSNKIYSYVVTKHCRTEQWHLLASAGFHWIDVGHFIDHYRHRCNYSCL